MNGNVVYFELPVPDATAARTFYGGLFGWNIEPENCRNYYMIPNASPLAGLSAG